MSSGFLSLPVRRPVFITVIYIIVVLIGLFSLWRLPIDLMPEVTYPTVSVITEYGNAGPQEIEELISRPIESALAGVQGIEELTSTSSEGRSLVRVSFTWGTNLDESVNDIRERIDRIIDNLPEESTRPMVRKFDLSAFPILMIGVESELDPTEVRRMVEDQVQYRLERVNGVASVDIWGGAEVQVHVKLRADALEALKLSPDMVISALRQENRNMPAGTVEQGNSEIIVRTLAEFTTIEDVSNTIITTRKGVPVRVSDVAEVTEDIEEITTLLRINRKPGIQLGISKQSGANTVNVAKDVRHEIDKINKDFPQLSILPLMDTSKYIRNAIRSVGVSLILGGAIALMVLLLFLQNVSSTLIIAVTIPISVIATFALVYFGGLTLNLMTFGGLALGIGMLVDNAIVVLDSIFHHREKGEEPKQSAIKGSSEVATAVIASTLTTIVVFFPVIFIEGMSGIMFKQLAYVVAFALACSLLTALTFIPMLSSRFLHMPSRDTSKGGLLKRIFGVAEKAYKAIENEYGKMITWALEHRKTVVGGALVSIAAAIFLVPFVGVELMPSADESEVRITLEMEIGSRLALVDSTTMMVEEIVMREVPEMEFMRASIGGGGWRSRGGHITEFRISLVPKNKRSRSSAQVAMDLRKALAHIPGATLRVREGGGLFILRMGQGGQNEVDIEVRGHDLQRGQELAMQIDNAIKDVEGVTDTRIGREAGMPELVLRIDRKKAADLGFTAYQVGAAVQTAMGGTRATTVRRKGKEYTVMVRFDENDRRHADQLMQMSVVNGRGVAVPLNTVARLERASGPVQIGRRDRERIIGIQANYAGRDMGSVVADIRERIQGVTVPSDFAVIIRGDYEEQQKAFRELMVGLIMAILLVYLVMAGQFESFRDPFVILFSIPTALIGIVLMLILTDTPFSINAYIGCIILTGIVVNNAIVLIDYTNRLRREKGLELFEAIKAAGTRRLRPILMSASTTSLGLLPLAFGLGDGGEAQAPMARVVIGGLIASTLITLLLIPVIYSIAEDRSKGRKTAKANRPAHAVRNNTAVILAAFLLIQGTQAISAQERSDTHADTPSFSQPHAEDSPAGIKPGAPVGLSLSRALTLAMRNNPVIKIDSIDVNIARAQLTEQYYRFEPAISASVNRRGETFDDAQQTRGSVSLSGKLPTGTSVGIEGGNTKADDNVLQGSAVAGYNGDVNLTITHPLLQNGGLGANLAPLRKAKAGLELSQAELELYAQQLLADVERTYWEVYLADREVSIMSRSLELAQRLLYETEEKLKAGKVAPLDLAVVQAETASRRKLLIDAQTSAMQRRLRLIYLLNDTSVDWSDSLRITDTPPSAENTDSLSPHIQAALRLRPDLRQARMQAKMGSLDVVQTRNGLLPRLDLFISLATGSYATSFGESFGAEDFRENQVDAGFKLALPVTNGAARQRHKRAVLNKEKVDISLLNMERLAELDVRSAWLELERTRQQIEAARVARELHEKRVDAEQEKLNAGKSTEYLLLQAQNELIAAGLDEARTEVMYADALTNLYLQDGTLLKRILGE